MAAFMLKPDLHQWPVDGASLRATAVGFSLYLSQMLAVQVVSLECTATTWACGCHR